MLIRGSRPLDLVTTGGSANAELRLPGRHGLWVVRMGSGDDAAAFEAAHPLTATGTDGTLTVEDPEYGPVRFLPDGTVEAEGRVLSPRDWTLEGERTVHDEASPDHQRGPSDEIRVRTTRTGRN